MRHKRVLWLRALYAQKWIEHNPETEKTPSKKQWRAYKKVYYQLKTAGQLSWQLKGWQRPAMEELSSVIA